MCIKQLLEDLAEPSDAEKNINSHLIVSEMSWVLDTLQSCQNQWGVFEGCLLTRTLT